MFVCLFVCLLYLSQQHSSPRVDQRAQDLVHLTEDLLEEDEPLSFELLTLLEFDGHVLDVGLVVQADVIHTTLVLLLGFRPLCFRLFWRGGGGGGRGLKKKRELDDVLAILTGYLLPSSCLCVLLHSPFSLQSNTRIPNTPVLTTVLR